MKRFNIHKFFNAVLATLVFMTAIACTAENDSFQEVGGNESSRLVEVKIGVMAPEGDMASIGTRAVDEYAVNNLYVLVFDANGTLRYSQYFNSNELNQPNDTYQGTTNMENTNYITATVPIGKAYIYGFANIDSEVYGNIKGLLDAINTLDDMQNAKVTIQETARNLTRIGSTLLMAGSCSNNNDGSYTITADTKEIKHIRLKRLDSQITFNFSAGTGSKFTALEWYCVNAPASSMLLEKSANPSATTYGNWDASNNADDFYTNYESKKYITNNTFTFFMPENRKVAKNSISNYNDRERETTENKLNHVPGTPRTYINAPDNATYVVVHGTFEGKANNEDVSADVTYVIHLGYLNNNANDFFSNRNTKYTYNVKVVGVESIIVEVEQDQETVPGATGEVIYLTNNNIYTLDAHYETVLLQFDLNDLVSRYQKAQGYDNQRRFRSIVSTPYSHLNNVDETKDKGWVKFVLNDNASTTLQTYNPNSQDFLTVDEMLQQLEDAAEEYVHNNKIIAPFNNQGKVSYTCFVDEFYYEDKDLPISEGVSASTFKSQLADNGVNLWKSFVNRPNRKLYVLCSSDNSADNESTVVSSAYIIEQRSIRTFYSIDPSTNAVIAYGIETINETGKLDWKGNKDIPKSKNSTKDGWSNYWGMVGGQNWNTLINHQANGYTSVAQNSTVQTNAKENLQEGMSFLMGMQNDYKYAYYACMQRNRNEAGSENIEKSDLKWYLPSVEQMQSYYIGETEMEEAQLYHYPVVENTKNSTDQRGKVYKHYATSTNKDGNEYGYYILWSEEGTSISTMAERLSWYNNAGNGGKYWNNHNYHYRCVRYLGTDNSRTTGQPYDNFATLGTNGGYDAITYDLLNSDARNRSAVTNQENLGAHIYDEEGNALSPNGFQIWYENVNRTSNYLYAIQDNCTSLGAGWRIPNLRELTLMRQLGVNDLNTMCRTRFKYDFRETWGTKSGGNIQMQNNDNNKIRCVRDIK
ncbi:MAG: hypothetical protein J6A40_00770 [Bacteroides sp.]|nr:hypothetical protein [Bacteroides sp.]